MNIDIIHNNLKTIFMAKWAPPRKQEIKQPDEVYMRYARALPLEIFNQAP